MKKIVALIMCAVLMLTCAFTLASCGGDDDTIKIGLSGPLTGGAAVYGKAVANALDLARITVNKNMIPFDPEKPFVTSGIRIGTPAITTRGLKEAEMVNVADFIERGVALREDENALRALGEEVKNFMAAFPMPQFK